MNTIQTGELRNNESGPGTHHGNPASIATGVVAIAIGLVFLARNLGLDVPLFAWAHWWALFIVIGAMAPLDRAWQRYREVGSVDSQVLHSLLNAVAVLTIAAIFLLNRAFGDWWPLFLIIGGLSMMTSDGCRASNLDRGAH